MGTSPIRGYPITKRGKGKDTKGLDRMAAGMSHNYPGGWREQDLFNRAKKFQSKEAHFPDRILAYDLGCDWRRLAGNQARRSGRWGRNRQVHDLIGTDDVGGGNAGPGSTDIKRLGELDEFGPGSVDTANKNWHLQTDARRTPG